MSVKNYYFHYSVHALDWKGQLNTMAVKKWGTQRCEKNRKAIQLPDKAGATFSSETEM